MFWPCSSLQPPTRNGLISLDMTYEKKLAQSDNRCCNRCESYNETYLLLTKTVGGPTHYVIWKLQPCGNLRIALSIKDTEACRRLLLIT